MSTPRRWLGLSWPVITGVLAFLPALRAPTGVLGDPDSYLHIALGRWIIAHGAVPSTDPFSYSMAGAPWHAMEWLSEVVLAVAYDLGGWRGVVLLTAACFAISIALLTRLLLRRSEPLLAVTLSLVAINVFLPHLLARPHVLALPFLVAFCGALFAARDEGRGPPYWALPLLLIWMNLHGSFIFGLGLVFYLGLEAVAYPSPGRGRVDEARSWGLFAIAAAAVTLVTPNGVDNYVSIAQVMKIVPVAQAHIAEWRNTDFGHFDSLELWLLGSILLAFSTGIRLPIFRLALLLLLLHEALAYTRQSDLVAFIGPLAIVGSLGPQLAERMRRGRISGFSSAMARLAAPVPWTMIPVLVLGGLLLGFAAMPHPIERDNTAITPTAALDAAERLSLGGPVFNSQILGGYMMFRGVPVLEDGRLELYGSDFLTRFFAASRGEEPALSELLERYRITWTLLAPAEGAVAALDRTRGWKRVYADNWAVIHVRTGDSGP